MKYSLDLVTPSNPQWIKTVLADFPSFLQDHLDCERKASSMAMSFVAKYPDRTEIIPELIETALEELEHFQSVYQIMASKGIGISHAIGKDIYVKDLLALCAHDKDQRFMDRLLLASVLECRGCERFKLVAENIQDPELKKFYKELWTSEAKHGNIFVKMALTYFPDKMVYDRLQWMLDQEAVILNSVEIRSALH